MISEPARKKRLGVVGTLVWDTIHAREGRSVPVEEWGGLAYALSALVAALPDDWEVVPLVKIGSDLSESARHFLNELPRVDTQTGVRTVPEPNNRVDLRYIDRDRRTERLQGGVPSWAWAELTPPVRSCDALYVNFISGFELTLDTARALRASFAGPIYADLHSLFMGVAHGGYRVPQELPSWGGWLRCFDAVQMNEPEFDLLGRATGDPWRLASEVVGSDLKLITVTLGGRGAAWIAGPGFEHDPFTWPAARRAMGVAGASRSGRAERSDGEVEGDPTGCGDVWGATFFARLLAGDTMDVALEAANRFAGRNVLHRGARGLHNHLLGRLSEGHR